MEEKRREVCCEKFKTSIGGQALIEGIMMRGPEMDAIVVSTKEGIKTQISPRKIYPKKDFRTWPFIRGCVNFFDAQVTGIKALLHSADLSPGEEAQEPSKFDLWLERKLGNEKFQKAFVAFAVFMGLGMSIALFFLLPMLIGGLFYHVVHSTLLQNLMEGIIRIVIFIGYLLTISKMKEMKRVFAYHGAEHKTIRCYEAGLPLTVDNVREMSRLHPRCGTSFLLVVMVVSILVFSVATSLLHLLFPALGALQIQGGIWYRLLMMAIKLLLLPLVVSVTYEINRWAGRNNNAFTRLLTAPGMWLQNFTTNEPDDSMIEVGIAALQAVLPTKEGDDRW